MQCNTNERRRKSTPIKRLLSIMVAAALPCALIPASAEAAEPVTAINIASLAERKATYTASWNKLAAINDGELSNDNAGMWGTHGHVSGDETLKYTFSGPQTVSSMKIHLWQDGSGVFLPTSLRVTYGSGNSGDTAVTNLQVSEITDAEYVTLTFDPVTAEYFKVVLGKRDSSKNGVAVNEWQIFATPTADMLRQLIDKGQALVDASSRTISSLKVKLITDGDALKLPSSLAVTTGDMQVYGSGSTPVKNLKVSEITDADYVTVSFDPVKASTFNLVFNKDKSKGVAASEVQILDVNGNNLASSTTGLYVSRFSYWNAVDVLKDGKDATMAEDGTVDQMSIWGTAGYETTSEIVTYTFNPYTIPTMDALTAALSTANAAVGSGDPGRIANAYAALLNAENSMLKRGKLSWKWSSTDGDSAKRLNIGYAMNYATNLWSMRTDMRGTVKARYKSGVPTAEGAPSDDYGNGEINFGSQFNRRVALHELAHVLGMYRYAWQWQNVLCTGSWHGPYANTAAGQTLSCDNSHGTVWPYGMNYDSEFSEANGKKAVDVIYGVRKDTMNPQPLILTSSSLPKATQWYAYTGKQLSAAPGYIAGKGKSTVSKYEIVNGRLPEGMTLTSAGKVEGKPTESGTFSFEVRATNAAGKASNTIMTLTVDPTQNPEVPANLVYYVDAGVRGNATSAEYDKIVKAYAKDGAALLNDKPDQQQNGKRWGASTTAKVRFASGTDKDDTALMATGKTLGYRFALEAGTYTLKAGLNGFGEASTMNQKVSWKGGSVNGETVSFDGSSATKATGTVTFTLAQKTTVTYTVTRTGGANPNLTWISVQHS
ncbi:Ig domain-containing protein [Bifidobacterium pseudolongum]|uniref:Ig domain-containing protein n=1 Tax=Bifidobacterium pseudolongum TaxID=1694 RepID=UPI001020C7E5|nr:putative Ig domain-containing protein [Bifidobacterium pseudolongum]RYQ76039.1 hypothetical protein PG2012B_0086 [Bifidobacterium pseudolongum subsp. globosum]